jgi:uncharacterized membrane protein YagU involved in acid resistance
MSIAKPLKKLVSAVILDLDGTLLHTGQLLHFGFIFHFTYMVVFAVTFLLVCGHNCSSI